MHDRKATPHRLGMDGVDVGDLDGELRDDRRRRVLAQDADLAVGLLGEANVRIQPMSMATWKPSRPA
jgi:hypothetical protein